MMKKCFLFHLKSSFRSQDIVKYFSPGLLNYNIGIRKDPGKQIHFFEIFLKNLNIPGIEHATQRIIFQ